MNKKWFFKEASGLNADIERHREKEQELLEKIKNSKDESWYKVYKNLYNLLMQSKADTVNKLGRK